MTVTYTVGDTREVIKTIADGSIDLLATSPPFYQLRSYVPNDHDAKSFEIGSEPDPASFLDTLLELTAEWGRVLAPHGSIAVELGDTYSGSGGPGGDYNEGGLREGQGKADGSARAQRQTDSLKARPKSLACIPDLYTIALAYGIHPLTGKESPAGKWLVRNKIVWHRPNPAVGALGDKVRPSTSYIVVATRSAKRWFDLTAVRGEPSANTHARLARGVEVAPRNGKSADRDGNYATMPELATTAGAPPLDAWFDPYDGTHDTWTLTTQPSRLAHYAMWPAKLAERLILSMCPREVCRVCSEPRRRVVAPFTLDAYRDSRRPQTVRAVALADAAGLTDEHIAAVRAFGTSDVGKATTLNNGSGKNTDAVKVLAAEAKDVLGGYFREFVQSTTATPTSTWTDCGHDDYRPGLVLDPFCGSGTTLAVADLHGRDAIGIDFDARNKAIYPARYDEVKRALYGTPAPMPGQEAFDFEVPA